MHDNRKATGERGDTDFLQTATLGDLHGPDLQGKGFTATGED